MWALRDSIASEVSVKVALQSDAWRKLSAGAAAYLENSPELYGAKAKLHHIYAMHGASTPADCELSERDAAFVSRATHMGVASPCDNAPDAIAEFVP